MLRIDILLWILIVAARRQRRDEHSNRRACLQTVWRRLQL